MDPGAAGAARKGFADSQAKIAVGGDRFCGTDGFPAVPNWIFSWRAILIYLLKSGQQSRFFNSQDSRPTKGKDRQVKSLRSKS